MVEGPGTTRNGMKASQLLNQKVFNVVVSDGKQQRLDQKQWWVNKRFTQVIKVGKELFLIFSPCIDTDSIFFPKEEKDFHQPTINCDEELAIRLHFQMSGTLHIERMNCKDPCVHAPIVGAARERTRMGDSGDIPTLEITLESHIIRAHRTAISTPMPAKAPRVRFHRLSLHDVCNPDFSLQSVLEQLHSPKLHISRETVISDVLLDQNILPGIGSIIKVEGLHNAGIHPNKPLSVLTDVELTSVIVSCKEYAMKWLQSGRAPLKRVYNRTICGSCQSPSVRMCRVGGSNRTTFWCSKCQVRIEEDSNRINNPKSGDKQQNKKLSLSNTNQRDIVRIGKVCPNHGPSTMALKRCRKIGPNEHRIFYSCNVRSCNFFCWADFNFPRCKCEKRTILRVSKTEKTGGRWFFSCPEHNGKMKGCQFFEWAENKHLERFGHLLMPLL